MRDLRLTINTNLKCGPHARVLIHKRNRTVGKIKRAVGFNYPVVNVTISLYRTLVRSNLRPNIRPNIIWSS